MASTRSTQIRRRARGSNQRVRKFDQSVKLEPNKASEVLLPRLVDCLAELGEFRGFSEGVRFAVFQAQLLALEPVPRAKLAALVVQAALGELHTLRWYTREAVALLHFLCSSGASGVFLPQRVKLERMFSAERLEVWAQLRHSRGEPRGLAFTSTWTYAIELWQVLSLLHSKRAADTLSRLLRLQRTSRFRWPERKRKILDRLESMQDAPQPLRLLCHVSSECAG